MWFLYIKTHLYLNKRQRRTCTGRWVRRRWRCCRDEEGYSGRRCAEGRAGWTSWTGMPPNRAPQACRSRFGHSSGSICTDSAFGKGISGMRTKLNVLLQLRVNISVLLHFSWDYEESDRNIRLTQVFEACLLEMPQNQGSGYYNCFMLTLIFLRQWWAQHFSDKEVRNFYKGLPVNKKVLAICISFSIQFSIWMVIKGFLWPSKHAGWWQKTFCDHPSQSLDGHWRFFATIQPYIVNIYIMFGLGRRVFCDHSTY